MWQGFHLHHLMTQRCTMTEPRCGRPPDSVAGALSAALGGAQGPNLVLRGDCGLPRVSVRGNGRKDNKCTRGTASGDAATRKFLSNPRTRTGCDVEPQSPQELRRLKLWVRTSVISVRHHSSKSLNNVCIYVQTSHGKQGTETLRHVLSPVSASVLVVPTRVVGHHGAGLSAPLCP